MQTLGFSKLNTMRLTLTIVENFLTSRADLRVIYSEGYELSFEHTHGLQIAVNRKSAVKAVRFWIKNILDPATIGLSSSARWTHYPASKRRAHLSAPKLTGPYEGRKGNDCWYIEIKEDQDMHALLAAYLK